MYIFTLIHLYIRSFDFPKSDSLQPFSEILEDYSLHYAFVPI